MLPHGNAACESGLCRDIVEDSERLNQCERSEYYMLAEIIGGGHTSKHQIQQGEIRASITSRNVGTSEDHQAS